MHYMQHVDYRKIYTVKVVIFQNFCPRDAIEICEALTFFFYNKKVRGGRKKVRGGPPRRLHTRGITGHVRCVCRSAWTPRSPPPFTSRGSSTAAPPPHPRRLPLAVRRRTGCAAPWRRAWGRGGTPSTWWRWTPASTGTGWFWRTVGRGRLVRRWPSPPSGPTSTGEGGGGGGRRRQDSGHL